MVADDYNGFVYNTLAYNVSLSAPKSMGFVSYKLASYVVENCYTNCKYYHDRSAELVSDKEINSNDFTDELNKNVIAYENHFKISRKTVIGLNSWKNKVVDIIDG